MRSRATTEDPIAATLAVLPIAAAALDAELRPVAMNCEALRLLSAGADAHCETFPDLIPGVYASPVRAAILAAHALGGLQRAPLSHPVDASPAWAALETLEIAPIEPPGSRARTIVMARGAVRQGPSDSAVYRRLIEASRDLIWSVDREGRWTFLNGACRDIYGREPEAMLGKPFAEFVLPAQLPVDYTIFARLLEGERIVGHVTRHVRADGSIADLSFNAEALRDERGEVIGTIGTAQDITQRRRAERKVYESEWRFRKLVELSPNAIMIQRDGVIAFGNPAAARMTGCAELVGTDLRALIAPTDRGRFDEVVALVTDDGRDAPAFEVRLRQPAGVEVHLELSCGPFTFDGAPASLLVARDITASKRAEEALRHERIFSELIVRVIPLFLCGIHPDGTTLIVNPAVCRATGYAERELIGTNWWSVFYPGDEYRQVDKLFSDMAAGGDVRDYLMTLTTRDGGKRTVAWTSFNRVAADGSLAMIVGIGTDLTDRLALEAQLNQSQKLESIGQLAAGIAHEINTPTQFVGDNLRFLKDAFNDLGALLASPAADAALKPGDAVYLREEIPKAIEQSIDGVGRVASIVRAMKDFSHPDRGERTAVDLNAAVLTTLTVARNEYKYVAEVETQLDPALPPVPCLAGEINQTLLNLIVNAAHAIAETAAARGRITISTRALGECVEIRVADTGAGIPDHVRPRLFQPFFTTKPVGKGTGQGLFIAHTVVVKKHGGTISFETEVGKGTTFIIRLPFAPCGAQGR